MLSEIDLTHHYTISDIEKPERNGVAFFLGFDCNLKYNYCINLHDNGSRLEQAKRKQMSPPTGSPPRTARSCVPICI